MNRKSLIIAVFGVILGLACYFPQNVTCEQFDTTIAISGGISDHYFETIGIIEGLRYRMYEKIGIEEGKPEMYVTQYGTYRCVPEKEIQGEN